MPSVFPTGRLIITRKLIREHVEQYKDAVAPAQKVGWCSALPVSGTPCKLVWVNRFNGLYSTLGLILSGLHCFAATTFLYIFPQRLHRDQVLNLHRFFDIHILLRHGEATLHTINSARPVYRPILRFYPYL